MVSKNLFHSKAFKETINQYGSSSYFDGTEVNRYQSAFAYSKLTIETLEKGVKYVQSSQQRHQNEAIFHNLF